MEIVSTKLMGGLGNVLFQIATAYAVSLRDGKKFICDTREMVIPHKPFSAYVNNILRKIEFSDKLPQMQHHGERGFEFYPIPKIGGNVKLIGHFQSEKYFSDYRNEILELFEIDEHTSNRLVKKYGEILNQDTCSIHVRRGDYVGLPNHHPTQPIEYYIEAVEKIGKEKHFLIFSDDLNWCKQNFDFIENKTLVSNNSDYEDLYLMSMCKNNIIANSTFSWWAAWLNKNENPTVIIPKKWFGPAYANFRTEDLYCKNWIKL